MVAVWREGLLARKVLMGLTKGYRHHPQLVRFSEYSDPSVAIDAYLSEIWNEAANRGYRFDGAKIEHCSLRGILEVPTGQLEYEFRHLMRKLAIRSVERYEVLKKNERVEPHPLFRVTAGGICSWEIVNDESSD